MRDLESVDAVIRRFKNASLSELREASERMRNEDPVIPLIVVENEEGEELGVIYRHCDGYVEHGLGAEILAGAIDINKDRRQSKVKVLTS